MGVRLAAYPPSLLRQVGVRVRVGRKVARKVSCLSPSLLRQVRVRVRVRRKVARKVSCLSPLPPAPG